jgi:hypothetical protein
MARAVDRAPSAIHRIWNTFGLQPHRAESIKLSTDPLLVEKVRDIVGLYMAPPEHALVLCMDKKSQIQALAVATGQSIGKCYPRHRSKEIRRFFDEIETAVPAELDVHLVMDDYATHKTQTIRNWLAKRPRWHVHLTPTGASWINQVERFFANLTDKQIRRGRSPFNPRTRDRHQGLHQYRQRRSQALQRNKVGDRHLGLNSALLSRSSAPA